MPIHLDVRARAFLRARTRTRTRALQLLHRLGSRRFREELV